MTCHVLIVGVPSPAGCDSTKTWRAAAELVRGRLVERFEGEVSFEYVELFGPDMARHHDIEAWIAAGEATPPIVVIDGFRRCVGGKLNLPAIERAVADALVAAVAPPALEESVP